MRIRRSLTVTIAVTASLAFVFACKKPDTQKTAEQAPAQTPMGAATAPAQAAATQALGPDAAGNGPSIDVDFVTAAATTDMFEVQAAKVADARSTNPDVKAFAREMIKAHTATTHALTGILKAENSKITPPAALDGMHKSELENLDKATGRSFDRMYIGQQVKAHSDASAVFAGYIKAGGDPKIEAFAKKTLPTIEHHLEMANKVQATIM
jgi:putative membrane protein